ncbi:bifunctional diaminohydroxyphosphoribosylaminopyrimidine deaminase/5-amino-6-(5-phosphoribosylamino)uracil reductase RibD [bacterium]|nr:bifunctional diaminohydroxyphosphoribosylaminopyrimidine deaminase/5-amino-6-(5-phosphoribosylamino)uracil reductase RibD [bacterium]
MKSALELAGKGMGSTSPNPVVGAVLVKNGKIIGKGYHKKAGLPHAEIEAITSATESLEGATLYVTLEPCCCYGKTPPCVDSIVNNKIKRVVAAMIDPNPKVSGQGIEFLRKHGVEAEVGLMEKEARRINEIYIKYITTNTPFVIVKIAQTIDGKIALPSGDSKWITGKESRKCVHEIRSRVDAVIVGKNTAVMDNPRLTVRLVEGRNPMRMVISASAEFPQNLNIFTDGKAETVILTKSVPQWIIEESPPNVSAWEFRINSDGHIDGKQFLTTLGEKGVTSVLIEGGAETFSWAISENIVDKLYIFIANKFFGHGIDAIQYLQTKKMGDSYEVTIDSVQRIGDDLLLIAYPTQ